MRMLAPLEVLQLVTSLRKLYLLLKEQLYLARALRDLKKKKKKKLVEEVSPQFISKTLHCVQDGIGPLTAPLIMGRL